MSDFKLYSGLKKWSENELVACFGCRISGFKFLMELKVHSPRTSIFDFCNGSLIPGLPNHIAVLCLLKVPRIYHLNLNAVSRLWRKVVRSSGFHEERRKSGIAEAWLVVLSAEPAKAKSLVYTAYDLQSKQLLFKVKFPSFDLETCGWNHYRLVAINEYFVLLGCDCSRANCTGVPAKDRQFTIYNTATNEWKCGAAIRVPRHRFACGAINGKLYITGGVNEKGKVERSTEIYDFETDSWKAAARMPEEVGCIDTDIVFKGKLYVKCSSITNCKETNFWAYDAGTDSWIQEAKLSSNYGQLGTTELVATDEFMYAVNAEGEFYRFEAIVGEWKAVGRGGQEVMDSSFDVQSRRAFGYGNEIFVLTSNNHARKWRLLDGVKCHKLFLGSSWYHAGTIVQA